MRIAATVSPGRVVLLRPGQVYCFEAEGRATRIRTARTLAAWEKELGPAAYFRSYVPVSRVSARM